MLAYTTNTPSIMRSPRKIQNVPVVRIQRVHALPSFHVHLVAPEDRRTPLARQSPDHHELVVAAGSQKMAVVAPPHHVHASYKQLISFMVSLQKRYSPKWLSIWHSIFATLGSDSSFSLTTGFTFQITIRPPEPPCPPVANRLPFGWTSTEKMGLLSEMNDSL